MSIVNAYYAYSFRNEYAKNSTRFLLSSLSLSLYLCSLDFILHSPFFAQPCLLSWHSCQTSRDTPKRRGSRNDIDPVAENIGI